MKQQLSEKKYIKVNGLRQGMILQSKNTENPVLLFLHGGPGSPEIAFNQEHPSGLENLFTVCWWEQRGSGISYCRNIPKETMTLEQMIADTIVVANYLRKRFRKNKIYIMGHSWGSVLEMNLFELVPRLDIPVYVFQGRFDYQVSYKLARRFVQKI